MSQENVELVSRMFSEDADLVELLASGDFSQAVDPAAFSSDMVVLFATPGGPAIEYRGFAGMLEGWADWLAPWARYRVEVEELRDGGDRVVALVTLRGTTRHDGVDIEQPAAAVVTVSGGKISRVEFHLDRREALESAGLSA